MDYTKRLWNSLTQLMKKIEDDGHEEVIYFNGHMLETDKWVYGLYDRVLTREPAEPKKKKTKKK